MGVVKRLNRAFFGQDFGSAATAADLEELHTAYRQLARGYAAVEQAVAVLSDLRTNTASLCSGTFGRTLGLVKRAPAEQQLDTVWEEQLLQRIHPDDLHRKYHQELRFFDLMTRMHRSQRDRHHLEAPLRMRDAAGHYREVLHRLFYITHPTQDTLWLTLCLYTPLVGALPAAGVVVDGENGTWQVLEEGASAAPSPLTPREVQVLRLVDSGMTSRGIAAALAISLHTVSRHRQQILARLRVSTSAAACRRARELGLL